MLARTSSKAEPSTHVKPNDMIGIVAAILTCIIFGLFPAASRAAYADGANTTFVLFAATFIRTLMLVAFCLITRKRLFVTKAHTKAALTGGFWQGIAMIGLMSALAFIQGPLVLTIMFMATLMLLFFMAWRKEIKLDALTVLTTIFVFGGLTVVLDVWSIQPSANWIGYGLASLAAVATTSRMYVYGHQMKTRNPAVVGAESFLVACFIVLLVAFWRLPVAPDSMAGLGWTLLSSLSLGVGSFGMFYGIALLGAFKWSLFSKIEPIFTSLFSVLFIGEYLKPSQYLGIVAVVGGLVIYQLISNRRKVAAAQVEA